LRFAAVGKPVKGIANINRDVGLNAGVPRADACVRASSAAARAAGLNRFKLGYQAPKPGSNVVVVIG
jgi:hypothetical protein